MTTRSPFADVIEDPDLNTKILGKDGADDAGYVTVSRIVDVPFAGTQVAAPDLDTKLLAKDGTAEAGYVTVEDVGALALTVPFTATGGATERTLASHLSDKGYSIMDGGSTGGVAPGQGNAAADTAALLNVLDDMPANGGRLIIPCAPDASFGLFQINAPIPISGIESLTIVGHGKGVGGLARVAGTGDGLFDITLDVNLHGNGRSVTVLDLSLVAWMDDAGEAFRITIPGGAGIINPTLLMNRVEMSSINPAGTNAWNYGLVLAGGVYNGHVSGCSFRGISADRTAMTAGIYSTSDDTDANVAISVSDSWFYNLDQGFLTDCHTEGVGFRRCDFVDVNKAIVWSPGASYQTQPWPGLWVSDCHSSAAEKFIDASYLADLIVHGCLVQKREGTSEDYIDIHILTDVERVSIFGNKFHGLGDGGTEDCLVIDGGGTNTEIKFKDNGVYDRIKGVQIKDGTPFTSYVDVEGNFWHPLSVSTPISCESTDATTRATMRFRDNLLRTNTVYGTFAANDATPAVSCSEGQYFLTNNSIATAITTFDEGYPGQIIHVVVNDVNTTFNHTVTLNLAGGVPWVAGGASVLTVIYDGALWREIARRTP